MDKTKLKSLLASVNTSLKEAMQKLDETAEKILFVIDEADKLLGTVTDGDIRRGLINGINFNACIEKIMNRNYIALTFNTPQLEENAKLLMHEKKIEQIPILDEYGRIFDVILWTDLLRRKKKKMPFLLKQCPVVIMAGGKGKRLDPITRILPKPLFPIGNKPVIELIMEKFYKHGFHKFIYTLNYMKEYVKIFLSENKFPYSIEWVEEDNFLGTAGSLSLLKDKITDTFFVVNCDSLLDVDFEDILAWHKEQKASITIIGSHNEYTIPYGVLEISSGKLKKILEKPIHDMIINTGAYVMEPHIISCIPKGNYLDMNKLINIISEKEKVTVYPIYKGWIDIGHWEEYKKSLKE